METFRKSQRIDEAKSPEALCELVRSLIDKDEREIVRTIYMNYDSIDNTSTNIYIKDLETVPAIFKDEDYADLAKEWLFSDYMQIDVMLPVSNEMDAGKGVWNPQTKEETGLCTDVSFSTYC